MTEIESKGSITHPVGWSFIGAGALAWLAPWIDAIGFTAWLGEYDIAIQIILVLFVASLLGIVIEFAMVPVEKGFLRFAKNRLEDLKSEQWKAAWQRRWRSPVADAEFRRYEGIVSVARAYSVHSLLGGMSWALALGNARGLVILLAGLVLTAFFGGMWFFNTKKIFLLVSVAHAWRDEH